MQTAIQTAAVRSIGIHHRSTLLLLFERVEVSVRTAIAVVQQVQQAVPAVADAMPSLRKYHVRFGHHIKQGRYLVRKNLTQKPSACVCACASNAVTGCSTSKSATHDKALHNNANAPTRARAAGTAVDQQWSSPLPSLMITVTRSRDRHQVLW